MPRPISPGRQTGGAWRTCHEGPVYVIDASGGTRQRIWDCGIEANGCTIAWSPDGTRIAVGHVTELVLIDPDGTNEARFFLPVGSVSQPTWAPDGTRIAFHSIDIGRGGGLEDQDRRLYVVDRDGSNLTAIGGPAKGYGFWDPAWTPDGRSIAYLGSTPHRSCSSTVGAATTCDDDWLLHLAIVDLDGTPPRDVVDTGACHCLGFMPGMTVSPDGRQAALVVPSGSDRDWGLEIVNVDGTGKRPVTPGWGPVAWQPIP
jgi:Tol biopolymer transport system component